MSEGRGRGCSGAAGDIPHSGREVTLKADCAVVAVRLCPRQTRPHSPEIRGQKAELCTFLRLVTRRLGADGATKDFRFRLHSVDSAFRRIVLV